MSHAAPPAPPQSAWRVLRSWVWIWDRKPWLLGALGGVITLLVGVLPAIWPIQSWWYGGLFSFLVVLAVALLIIAPLLAVRREEQVRDLRARIGRLEAARDRDLRNLRSLVQEVAEALLQSTGVTDSESRISVYQHHALQKRFILLGRYSTNLELRQHGRASYPDDHGIIAEAWKKGHASFKTNFVNDRWDSTMREQFGLPLEVLATIKMRSRTLMGVRVDDGTAEVGVIVLESTQVHDWNNSLGDSIAQEPAFTRLAALLRAAPRMPLPEENQNR